MLSGRRVFSCTCAPVSLLINRSLLRDAQLLDLHPQQMDVAGGA